MPIQRLLQLSDFLEETYLKIQPVAESDTVQQAAGPVQVPY